MIQLTIKGCIYVPTTPSEEQGRRFAKGIAEQLTALFGGANISEIKGYWKSENGGIIEETNYLVTVWVTSEESPRLFETLKSYAFQIKDHFNQEAVSVEMYNKLMLI